MDDLGVITPILRNHHIYIYMYIYNKYIYIYYKYISHGMTNGGVILGISWYDNPWNLRGSSSQDIPSKEHNAIECSVRCLETPNAEFACVGSQITQNAGVGKFPFRDLTMFHITFRYLLEMKYPQELRDVKNWDIYWSFQGKISTSEASTAQPIRSRLKWNGPTVSGTSHPTESQ